MAVALFSTLFQRQTSSGTPGAGDLLFFYSPGTTTPITTYADAALGTPSTTVLQSDGSSAIVADASGLFAPIYVTTSPFKFVLKTSALVTVQTVDPAYVPVSSGGSTAVLFGDGTVSLPGIAFTNDPDTGLYRIGANDLGVAVGGVKVGEFTSAGFVDAFSSAFTKASSAGPASLDFAEDTDNGTNKITLTAPSSISSDVTVTLPTTTGTLALQDPMAEQIVSPVNIGLAASISGNALTVSLKGADGNDPSSTNPVYVPFKNATETTGLLAWLKITSATSLTISSGSTLGTTNAVAARIWIVAFNDAGTIRLGAVNCLSSLGILHLRNGIRSSTAEGGAGAADSAQVIYTGTAVSSKAMTILGYIEATEATAGTWATAPSRIKPIQLGDALPGDIIQTQVSTDAVMATGTTVLPVDDTIPQNTEGVQSMTLAVTPISACNLLDIEHTGGYANSNATDSLIAVALFQDTAADALRVAGGARDSVANGVTTAILRHRMLAATESATTFKIRAGCPTAGTTTFNGSGGARKFGGVAASMLMIREIMA